MILTKLVIRNFQCYEKVVFNFVNGINAIIGKSDAGKSAVVSALNLLFNNRPLGGKYFCDTAGPSGTMSVKAFFDEGTKVKLERRIKVVERNGKKQKKVVPGSPKYTVWIPDSKPKTFQGFKGTVPTEVQQALNIEPINVQKQFDSAFLVEEGGSKIARFINELIQAEDVDKWQSKANSLVTKSNAEVKVATEELSDVKAKLKGLSSLDEVELMYEKFRQYEDKLDLVSNTIDDLEMLSDQLDECNESISKLSPALKELDKAYYEYNKALGPTSQQIWSIDNTLDILGQYLLCEMDIKRVSAAEFKAEEEYDEILTRNGVCPFCGGNV